MSPNWGVIAGSWMEKPTFFPWAPATFPCALYSFIRFTKSTFNRGLFAGIMLLSAGCATIDNPDPYEGMNRSVMAFNDGADRMVLKPLAKGYMNVTSAPVRSSVTNFYDNFAYPITIINQFLQGKVRYGFSDLGRFLTNTTLGILGVFDVATGFGLEYHDEDFGQTLGVWGVESGAYLVIPLWGPVTTRSGVGDIASFYTHPVQFIDEDAIRYGLFAGWAIQTRASLLEAEDLVIGDRYVFIRDVYLQRREFLVNDGEIEEDPFLDTID